MDRRRFLNKESLTEDFQPTKSRYLLEDVFNELNRLYEATEQSEEATEDQPEADNEVEDAGDAGDAGSIDDIQKEIKDVDVPAANIKLTGKAEELYNDLIDILQKSNLESAVTNLEIVSADPKLKLLLSHGFTNGSDENETVDVTIAASEVPVSKMIPTQKEIGTDGSLKNILTGKHPKGTVEFADYFAGGAVKSMPGPFVYQDGDSFYIVDGHHRWSQTYCLNPHASLNCQVLTSSTKLTIEEVLKNFQAAIAADTKRNGLGRKPFEGENFFTFATNAASVIGYLKDMGEDVATKIANNAAKALTEEVNTAVQTYGAQIETESKPKKVAIAWVTNNAVALANGVAAESNPTRLLMPQSDDNTFDIVKDTLAVGK